MSAGVPFEVTPEQAAEIRKRADERGVAPEAFLKGLIDDALEKDREFRQMIDEFAGCIDSDIKPSDDWSKEIYEHNWRP